MLKDITWKLEAPEYSSVIAFENLFSIVSFCGFQNIWSFSVFVTISIHSWLLLTLIACWLAISEEISLKSIYLFLLNQILWISFSQVKSSIKSKGVWIGRTHLSQESCVEILSKILSLGYLCSHAYFSQYLKAILSLEVQASKRFQIFFFSREYNPMWIILIFLWQSPLQSCPNPLKIRSPL
jgi:hypothetical protein